MGLPRSTYYDAPAVKADDAGIVVAMTATAMSLRPMAIAALAQSFSIEGWSLIQRRFVA
jgi:hypothetical protein